MSSSDQDFPSRASREDRINEAIAAYLEAVEQGATPDEREFLAQHADIAEELKSFFANEAQLEGQFQALANVPSEWPDSRSSEPSTDPQDGNAREQKGEIEPTPAEMPTQMFQQRGVPSSKPVLRYFGDYELLEEIARGGMGVVFKARQVKLNRIVAVKMILAGSFAGPEDIERFHTEAEAAAQLDHPGIVPIYEVGQQAGQHYFSMRFVDGQSLARKIAAGPLPPREAAEIVKAVAEAVQYAHEKGVIHRDLKPGNILLDSQGKPRVTDFGLAKLTESGSDLTGTGQVLGTPSYMPPEQAAAQVSAVGRLSDVYSLGAILYCLVTGRPPFQAASPLETLFQVQRQEPVAPRQLNLEVPLDLDTIILKCLDKSPSRRYDSAQALGDELQRYLEGRPIIARPVGRLERFWRWCQREPIVSSLCAAVALALIAGTIISTYYGKLASKRADENAELADANGKLANEKGKFADKNLQLFESERDAKEEERQAKEKAENHRQDAVRSADVARERARELRRALYLSDMNRIAEYARIPNIERIQFLLTRHIPENPDDEDLRGFDWHYWWKFAHASLLTIETGAPVELVTVTPDGKKIAAGCTGGDLQLYESQSGESLPMRLSLEERHWAALKFNQDGSLLVAADTTGDVRTWELGAGKVVGRTSRTTFPNQIEERLVTRWPAAVTADEKMFVAPDPQRQGLALWSNFGEWNGLIGLSDGQYITKIQGMQSGKPVQTLWGEFRKFIDPSQIPNAPANLFSYTVMPPMKSWIIGQSQSPLEEEWGAPVFALAVSPKGGWIAEGNREGQVRIWNTKDRTLHKTCWEHTGIVWQVAFSADERLLASAGQDGQVIVWEVATGESRLRYSEHVGPVRDVLFLPGDRKLASTGDDRTIRLWSSETGRTARVFLGHTARVNSLALIRGNEAMSDRLASAGLDRTIRLWELHAPPDRMIPHASNNLFQSAISPDGSILVAQKSPFQGFHVWDVEKREYRGSLTAPADVLVKNVWHSNAVALSAERRLIAVAFSTDVVVWNCDRLKPEARFNLRESAKNLQFGQFHCCALSRDGRLLAAGTDQGHAVVWDVKTGEVTQSWNYPQPCEIHEIRFLADNGSVFVVLSGPKHEFRTRQLDNGDETTLALPLLPLNTSNGVTFSPVGDRLALLNRTGVQIMRLEEGLPVDTLVPAQDGPDWVRFSVDGRILAIHARRNGEGSLQLWDVGTRTLLKSVPSPPVAAGLQFVERERSMAVFLTSGIVEIWSLAGGGHQGELVVPAGSVTSISATADQKGVTLGVRSDFNVELNSNEGLIVNVRLPEGKQLEANRLFIPDPWLTHLPDGGGFVDSDGFHGAGLRRIWSLPVTTQAVSGRIFTYHDKSGNSEKVSVFTSSLIAVSRDSRQFASIDPGGGAIQLWRRTGQQAAADASPVRRTTLLRNTLQQVRGISFSPDGRQVAVAGDQVLQIWDLVKQSLVTFSGHAGIVNAAAWSRDGQTVASASSDGTIRLWNRDEERELMVLKGHLGPVRAIVFPNDDESLISGGEDGEVLVWDRATGEVRLRLSGHTGAIQCLWLSADGALLISGSSDGSVRFWRSERLPNAASHPSLPTGESPQPPEPAELAAPATEASAPDRRAAAWMQAQGIEFGIVVDGNDRPGKSIPPGDFFVSYVQARAANRRAIADDGLKNLRGLSKLKSLNLAESPVSPRDLAELTGYPALEQLNLSQTDFTDTPLDGFQDAHNLQSLILQNSGSVEAALSGLEKFPQLFHLDLSGSKVTDQALRPLSLLLNLRVLALSDTGVGNGPLEAIRNLPALHSVSLDRTQVTDFGLAEIGQMAALRCFSANETGLGDAAATALSRAPQLLALRLDATNISDTGLLALRSLKTLKLLSVARTKVTLAGLTQFALDRPEVIVNVDPNLAGDNDDLRVLLLLTAEHPIFSITRFQFPWFYRPPQISQWLEFPEPRNSLDGQQVPREAAIERLQKGGRLTEVECRRSRHAPASPIPEILPRLQDLRSLSLVGDGWSDDDLRQLDRLPHLTSLNLSGAQITDQGLLHLKPRKNLVSLNLSDTLVTNRGLDSLAKLPGLEALDVTRTKITISAIGAAVPRLRELRYRAPELLIADLDALSAFREIEVLILSETQLTDAAAERLAKLQFPKLKTLEMNVDRSLKEKSRRELIKAYPALDSQIRQSK